MKKIYTLMMVFMTIIISAKADDYQRLDFNVGAFAPYTLDATVTYEYPIGYGHSIVAFGEAGTHWQTPVCHMFWKKLFWDGGLGYRHRVTRMKNSEFRLLGDVYCGSFAKNFFLGFDLGLEYNYTFANNWQFTVQERNCFQFLHHADTFRNGLMVGLKIPF